MTDEELREAIQKQASNGKVRCESMLKLAQETGRPPRQIGLLCDEMNIRISACQLGCFK